jgi:cytoskeletal protein RodZ
VRLPQEEIDKLPNDLRNGDRPASERELASRSSGEGGKVTRLPTNKARQGLLGLPVLLVLVAALVLVALAWWGAELYGDAIAPENPSGSAAEPSANQ